MLLKTISMSLLMLSLGCGGDDNSGSSGGDDNSGSSPSTGQVPAQQTINEKKDSSDSKNPDSESDTNRQGACTINGNIRGFKIECDKNISAIRYKFFQSQSLNLQGTINGQKHNLVIKKESPSTIVGRDLLQDKLIFTVLHEKSENGESESSEITLDLRGEKV